MRGLASVLGFLLAASLAAEDQFGLETSWTVHQTLGEGSGIEAATALSGVTDPSLWVSLGAGLETVTTASGRFESFDPGVVLKAGVMVPALERFTLVPWAGGRWGVSLSPAAQGFFQALVGADLEVRLWGNDVVVVGLAGRSDLALEVSVGFRNRTRWALPSTPGEPWFSAPPSVRLVPGPGLFSPDEDGENDVLEVRWTTQGSWPIKGWSWTIVAPGGQVFFQKTGTGVPPLGIHWDGVSSSGELVSSATDYTLVAGVVDELGREASGSVPFTTDVLVLRDGDRYLIRVPSINFVANSPGALPTSTEPADRLQMTLLEQNARVIQRLADILQRFPQYTITIVGHANLVHWEDPVRAKVEDRTESQPLSLQRAQAVKAALVRLGLDPRRITTEGAGGSRPLFPFGDAENAWKNRRVDIILDRRERAAN